MMNSNFKFKGEPLVFQMCLTIEIFSVLLVYAEIPTCVRFIERYFLKNHYLSSFLETDLEEPTEHNVFSLANLQRIIEIA